MDGVFMSALTKKTNKKWLKKYTKLYYLKEILTDKRLFLGDPKEWPDKNDRHCLLKYAAYADSSEIRATCLNRGSDRYHFWEVYGEKCDGVCLWFHRDQLIGDIKNDTSLRSKNVIYKEHKSVACIDPEDVPFAKRKQYKDEVEFRVIRTRSNGCYHFDFRPNSLARVYLNPWLEPAEVSHWKREIGRWWGSEYNDLCVKQNRSLDYRKWKDAVTGVLNGNPKQT